MAIKVTIIGGGSSIFVPGLIRRFLRSPIMKGGVVTLMDVNEERVKVMEALGRRLAESERADLTVESSLDRRAALTGADFVIVAISVGGMPAWEQDIEIPARYGVFAEVCDSTGPSGIMRAFRNVPVLAGVARDTADVAPDAWIFNYTNPAPVQALAMRTVPEVKSLSLCSCTGMPSSPAWLAEQAGVSPDEIAMPVIVGGINHCAGVVEMRLKDGRDALALVREHTENPVVRWALDRFGVLPYCWSHWVEFYPQMQGLTEPYQGRAQGLAMRYGLRVYDMETQSARVKEWEDLAQRWTAPDAGPVTLSDLPEGKEDEGIQVVDVMESIVENRGQIFIINTTNHGAITNLPDDAIVEVPAYVSAAGIRPVHVGALAPGLAAHLRAHWSGHELTCAAALTGDRNAALQAFLVDPLLQARLAVDQTEQLLDEMLEANARYLPQFSHLSARVSSVA
jgi:alpha-galactosidase